VTAPDSTTDRPVRLGHVVGVHGVKGWLKIHSFTEPRENVVRFEEWTLAQAARRWRARLEAGRGQGPSVLAKLEGIDDRDAAIALIGAEIYVDRASLPGLGPREYYWTDLEGLEVHGRDGSVLGRVDHLIATGAHDVMVLDGRPGRLIPFVLDDIVTDVDLDAGRLVVDWDATYWDD
jgi:16S rRNA processing protein RimM